MKKLLPKIIIDTDAGHDDVLAMMLLIKSGRFDILGITTVAGNSTIENATRNVAFTLDLLKSRQIPIFSGNAKPLKRKLIQAVVHGKSGLDGVDTSKAKFTLTNDALTQTINLIRSNPNEVTILTLGPLTNIARAFIADPKLPSLVKKIVIMGGAINVCGNKNRVAEFNMFVDPEAADIVFKAPVNKIVIPVDICNDMPLFISDFNRLKGSYLYRPVMNMMKHFIAGIKKYEGTKGALVYDAVAAYYLLYPKAFTIEAMDIVIETKGEYTFGMTVAEKRISAKKNINAHVGLQLNRKKFVEDFIKILK